MSKALIVCPHPQNPDPHLVRHIVAGLKKGQIWILPTDSTYVLACMLDNKSAIEKMRQIRGLDHKHFFSLACHDLAKLSELARVDNQQFRLLKLALPGPWTFILPATAEIPRRLAHPSRKTIGLRIPQNLVIQAVLALLEEPLVITTAQSKEATEVATEVWELEEQFQHVVDGIASIGQCSQLPTTIIDLSVYPYQLLRQGQLSPEKIGLNIE